MMNEEVTWWGTSLIWVGNREKGVKNVNVNVHVYNPDIYKGSADRTVTPMLLDHTASRSNLLGRAFC